MLLIAFLVMNARLLGGAYLESSGLRTWQADAYFFGGSTFNVTTPIENTVDDTIYQSIRIGTFSYNIPVPVGVYEINIHLAEM